MLVQLIPLEMYMHRSKHTGTSNKGPSKKGTASLQRILVAAPC